jgi:hypothetical protein
VSGEARVRVPVEQLMGLPTRETLAAEKAAKAAEDQAKALTRIAAATERIADQLEGRGERCGPLGEIQYILEQQRGR